MINNGLLESLASPGFLLIAGYFYSWFGLETLQRLSHKKEKTEVWVLFAALVNAIILVVWNFNSQNVRPIALLIIPAVLIFDLYFLTNDTWWAYLNFFFLALLNSFCLYGISNAIVSIFMKNPWPIGSGEHRRILLTMTLFLATLIFWGIANSRLMSTDELAELLHSRERGKLLFTYICATSVVLLISAMLTLTLIYDDTLPKRVSLIIHTELALKDLLILVGSFLIIALQVWEEKKRQQIEAIDWDLKMERQFRENSQEDSIFRFCFDLSLGEITEGKWFFQCLDDEYEYDSAAILEDFRKNCIHEEERNFLIPLKDLAEHSFDPDAHSHYTFNMRMSLDYLLHKMSLLDTARTELEELEKEWVWTRVQITIVEDEQTGDILCHLSAINIDKEISHSESLRRAASIDSLTGLYNRAAMDQKMGEVFAQNNVSGTLFMIDMDHFKSVNDTLGHPVGDRVLQQTAGILKRVFRGRDLISRLGGDEFCVFAPGLISERLVRERAEELNRMGRLCHRSENPKARIQTSFSIGAAICINEWEGEYAELYNRADLALYEAKKAGRDTYRLYSSNRSYRSRNEQ